MRTLKMNWLVKCLLAIAAVVPLAASDCDINIEGWVPGVVYDYVIYDDWRYYDPAPVVIYDDYYYDDCWSCGWWRTTGEGDGVVSKPTKGGRK